MRRLLGILFGIAFLLPAMAWAHPTGQPWWLGTGGGGGGDIGSLTDTGNLCAALQWMRRNAGDTAFECAAAPGGGDALKADPLSQFATTTAAQLAGLFVAGEKTGTGKVVFNTAPTFSGQITADTLLLSAAGARIDLSGTAPLIAFNNTAGGLNVAGAGVVRLEHDQTICWRNNAADGDVCLSVNGSDAPLFDGSPLGGGTADLGTLTDTGNLCAANQAMVRNAGDTGFECADFPAGTGTVTGITGDTGAATNAAVPKIVGGTGIVTVSEATTDTITVGLSETVDLTSATPCQDLQNAINPWILDPTTAVTIDVVGSNTIDYDDLNVEQDHAVCAEVIPSTTAAQGTYPTVEDTSIVQAASAPLTINWKGHLDYDCAGGSAQAKPTIDFLAGGFYNVGHDTDVGTGADGGGGVGAAIRVHGLSIAHIGDCDAGWTDTTTAELPFSTKAAATTSVGIMLAGTTDTTFTGLNLQGKAGDLDDVGFITDQVYGNNVDGFKLNNWASQFQAYGNQSGSQFANGTFESSTSPGVRRNVTLGSIRNANSSNVPVSATCVRGGGFCTGDRIFAVQALSMDNVIVQGGAYGNIVASNCQDCTFSRMYIEPGDIAFHSEIWGAGVCSGGGSTGAPIANGGACFAASDCDGGTCSSLSLGGNTIRGLTLSGEFATGTDTSFAAHTLGPGALVPAPGFTATDWYNIRVTGGQITPSHISTIDAAYYPIFDWVSGVAMTLDLRDAIFNQERTPGTGDLVGYYTGTANSAGQAYPGTILWPPDPNDDGSQITTSAGSTFTGGAAEINDLTTMTGVAVGEIAVGTGADTGAYTDSPTLGGTVTAAGFTTSPGATPTLDFDDSVETDTGVESKIVGDAVADDNGSISLQVEDNADDTYKEGLRVFSTAGATVTQIGNATSYFNVGEGGLMTNSAGTAAGAITLGSTTPQIVLGTNTSVLGSIKMFGSTSGDVTIKPNVVAGTATALTLPAVTGTIPVVIAAGTVTLTSMSEIASTACHAVKQEATGTTTNVATTDVISWTPNGDISAVTGYAPVTAGAVIIYPYPTAGHVNFKVCNPTSDPITPGNVTLNYIVTR